MTEWLASYEADGELFFRIGRDGADVIVAEWLGIVRLVARRDGTYHRLEPDPNADPRELAKVERGGVKLLLRHLAGKVALHGAAIASGDKGLVLLGRAHQGKSTLAAALCARPEVALLSDDAVAVDPKNGGFIVTALEELHWLDSAARRAVRGLSTGGAETDEDAEGKRPVTAARIADQAQLVAFVDLVFTDGPTRLVRSSQMEAMTALVPQAVRFVIDDPAVVRRELDMLGNLVDAVPMFRLERPRNLGLLSESCNLLLDLLGGPRAAPSEA